MRDQQTAANHQLYYITDELHHWL